MNILTVIGARPQFIKASVVSKAFGDIDGFKEIIVHTGQHFDSNMSRVFFEQLKIPAPNYKLNINKCNHGEMTGRMLIEIEKIILLEKPGLVLVYGDTNSTLAGALAAKKLHIPVAHVEAGLRSYNMSMPEEINRILTDQISDILFCPTEVACNNLEKEGFKDKLVDIELVGDVMRDSALMLAPFSKPPPGLLHDNGFILATLHRAENTNNQARLSTIVDALNEVQKRVATIILPIHPRTLNAIRNAGLDLKVNHIAPVGYLEMLWLLQRCSLVVTDSGGLQKEAFFFRKPCVTLRDETEWTELVDIDANILSGADTPAIVNAINMSLGKVIGGNNQIYGAGNASVKIAEKIRERFSKQ